MGPHREEEPKPLEPGAERKPKRFRIVKLEERIAPGHGHGGGKPTVFTQCAVVCFQSMNCYTVG